MPALEEQKERKGAKIISMRKIIVSEFLTLDGVMEAPGGEKSLGNRSGWTFPFFNEEQERFKHDELFDADSLLLGGVTYEGFAAAWPNMPDTGDFGERMNTMPKYVVSTTLSELTWKNSTLIDRNIYEEIRDLKTKEGKDILVFGSAQLVHTLMEHKLIDEYRLMVFPVILGIGKRLFPNGIDSMSLHHVKTQTFANGVVVLTYQTAPIIK